MGKSGPFERRLRDGGAEGILGTAGSMGKPCGLRKERCWKRVAGSEGGWLGGDLVLG